MIHQILLKISLKENKRRYLNLKGIASKRYAYKGPDVVQIDLTDRCNSHCNICWLHSPFVEKGTDLNNSELDPSVLKNFIGDIAKSGTKEIIFSGGGEPFLYPKIWEVFGYAQNAGLYFRVNTNFILLNEADIGRLLSFDKLASLTVSAWAGESGLYCSIHNRNQDAFSKLKDNLRFINIRKGRKIKVRLYAVIDNENYRGLGDILDLALQTGCDEIEFGVSDAIPSATARFLLTESQLSILKKDFAGLLGQLSNSNSRLKIVNKNLFLKRILSPGACRGEYDYLAGQIPCYAGWVFLRLRANGDFNSCLKSHRIPIGNIYKDGFYSVWNGPRQQAFRENGRRLPRDWEYFKVMSNSETDNMGCRRLCDNMLVNKHIYNVIRYLFGFNRWLS